MKFDPRISPVPIYDSLLVKDALGNFVLSPVWQNWFLDLHRQIQLLQEKKV